MTSVAGKAFRACLSLLASTFPASLATLPNANTRVLFTPGRDGDFALKLPSPIEAERPPPSPREFPLTNLRVPHRPFESLAS
jgi:hypothetical protein